MNKEFVSNQQALELQQLGFDEPCLMYYDYSSKLIESGVYKCKAPLYQQAFKFFRDKHNLHSNIKCVNTTHNNHFRFEIELNGETLACTNRIDSYEKAELACLQKLITILK